MSTEDVNPGAPEDEMLQLFGLDDEGRIALHVWFDIEDMDAALAELDAVHARFEQEHPLARRLQNAASQVIERFLACFAVRDWDTSAEILADDISTEDRRRVVNAGIRQDRAAEIKDFRSAADLGVTNATSDVTATRGERLVLIRSRLSRSDEEPESFHVDLLWVVEIDTDDRIAAWVTFDLDDFDAAIAELDARYLAGEAAAYAHTWSVVMRPYDAINRQELFATTPDWVNIDHRRGATFAAGDANAYVRASLDDGAGSIYVETVHRLGDLGAVVTWAATGTTHEGFDAEWRGIHVLTVDGDLISRFEVFDEDDLDAAIARFDQLGQPARRLENAASRVFENEWSHFAARDWDALAELVADNYSGIDHRRVVRAENQHGRDVVVKDLQAAADVGFTISMLSAIAIRGERLVLARVRASGRDPKAIQNDALNVVEIDAEERIVAAVTFDLEDFDAAIAELEFRYITGEAAAYAHTWSVIQAGYAGFNRRELLATTPDWVSIDHRRGAGFAPGDMIAYIQAAWDDSPDTKIYIGAVHRLSKIGAVVTHLARGISQEGFDAEWRDVHVLAVEGDMFSRAELFDEADLDAAIARFEQLCQPAPRLENAASRANERTHAYFAARDWDSLAEIVADDISTDDRRRVVNAGLLHGRDASIESFRWAADLGVTHATSDPIATRGERLVLTRARYSHSDDQPQPFDVDLLHIVEINADERIGAVVIFDLEDFPAAIAELDARYLAGEAAAHAHTWSVIMQGYASLNRRELPPTTPDWVNIDHRRVTSIAPGEIPELLTAAWNVTSDLNNFVEAVHRLDNLGGVVTTVANETSQEGFHAEWRVLSVFTVEGDLIDRLEVFDEGDLDAALARFEQLSRPAPRLENTASQVAERFMVPFTEGDWDAVAEMLADNFSSDDRRRVVGAGVRLGRDAQIADVRTIADLWIMRPTVMATRGDRLVLMRVHFSARDQGPAAFLTEALSIVEINADERIIATVAFGIDDIDAAIAELDARYLAGEATVYARTWSTIARGFAALNRGELPAVTQDWVNDDHRHAASMAPGEGIDYFRASWELAADLNVYIEAVHRLSDLGAVFTHVGKGTSRDGFEAEWRTVDIMTVEGDLISRGELFDEADVDAAIAKFDQLSRSAPRLENTASRVNARFLACVNASDWDAIASILADDFCSDDRRRVTGAGTRRGRDAEIENMRVVADLGANITVEVIATRGDRLVLTRTRVSFDQQQQQQGFLADVLGLAETNLDGHIAAVTLLDLEDIEAAFEELDARYLAGEAAAHARTWSVISGSYAAINRHEMPLTTPDCANVDHRRETAMGVGDLIAYISAGPDRDQDNKAYVEAVHRLTERGAVVTYAAHETSQEGFDAEWRGIAVFTVDGDMVSRTEVFDEADLDTALARSNQLSRSAPRLENAASQVGDRFLAHFAAGDWEAMAKILADNLSNQDRRRVISTGIFDGRDAQMANTRAIAELWSTNVTRTVMATRGRNLSLARVTFSRGDGVEAFLTETLSVLEISADERISAIIVFDLDDIDAAFEELDARYLAGEAAAYAHTWSVIAGAYAALNRHEFPATTTDLVNIDHRGETMFGPGDLIAYLRARLDFEQDFNIYTEAVHRLTDLGAVVTYAAHATSQEGFEAEWRGVSVFAVEGDMVNRWEVFDEADLDAAIASFEELSRPAAQLENAATQSYERIEAHFAARDWDAMAEALADEIFRDDRRRVVGAELRKGRDAMVAEFSALAEIGVKRITFDTIAIRGSRLVLSRARASGRDPRADAFRTDVLCIAELDADGRTAALITFDPDDFDAAFAELDARYLAGEAAVHSRMWSVIVGAYGAINRRELPSTTPDFEDGDHRRGAAFATGDMIAYLRAGWDLDQDISFYIEAVHRLSDLGAVVTHKGCGTSREGFDAEWREVMLFTADGDSFSRCEVFNDTDLDAAIARFDQLSQPAPRLENAASQVTERFAVHLRASDWDAMAELLADDFCSDDRRGVVGAGIQHGPDAHMADMRTIVDLWITNVSSTIIATRGERLVLVRTHFSGSDQGPGAFLTEVFGLVEIDTDERIVAIVSFDLEDFDAAVAELDARYLAGEGAAHAHVWSVIAGGFGSIRRYELPPTTPDCVSIDHRRTAAFAPGELNAYFRAAFDLTADAKIYVEAVHRLNDVGTVCTHVSQGVSHEGFAAEWREVDVLMVEGNIVNHCEIFDEADIDAALARFDELQPQSPRLENTASQVGARYRAHFAAGNWDAMADIIADDFFGDDRRRVVGSGVRIGREAQIADMRAIADLFIANMTWTNMATRGDRLVLFRVGFLDRDQKPDAFRTEVLCVAEVDADEQFVASVSFDLDDVDAAFEELDARYLAGEAAAHARTWSVITGGHAALNRHELPPTTPDCVSIDHRRGAAFAPGELVAYFRAGWDLDQNIRTYVEVVHRLSDLGAVCTHVAHGFSQEGFDAEWRGVDLLTVDGDMVKRCEVFDEADLDAALAKFEELSRPAPRLENAASQMGVRFLAHFAAGDWDAMAEVLADGFSNDDRRRVVGAGVRHGRDAEVANARTTAQLWTTNVTPTVMATRGRSLVLARLGFSGRDDGPEPFLTEVLSILEINDDERMVALVTFDLDDIDAAFAELEARYLAGEAAANAQTWSLVVAAYAAFDRHELPAADWVTVDHRRATPFASSTMTESLRAIWDLTPALKIHIETVHRLDSFGAVITHEGHGSSQEGFDAEWRAIDLLTVEGDRITGCEIFDEADIDAALTRFDELQTQARRVENAASRVYDRFQARFAAHDWVTISQMLADDVFTEDRRPVVNLGRRRGRDAVITEISALSDVGVKYVTSDFIATRGEYLLLSRTRSSGRDQRPDAFQTVDLDILEVDAEERVTARIVFDLNDIDAAFAELDARYLAGEAAEYQRTWSAIAGMYASFNRHELPATTPDWVTVDHRPVATFEFRDASEFFRSTWDITPHVRIYAEAVHRLTSLGAVVTHVVHATSEDGFDAEWRISSIVTVKGDLISGCELFDDADLDAALATFEELSPQVRRFENAATGVQRRLESYFAARDWDAMAETLVADISMDDRRRVVGAGRRQGRDAVIAELSALAEVGVTSMTPDLIAIRGGHLVLSRVRASGRDQRPDAFRTDVLDVLDVDADGLVVARVVFDADDLDAAIAELDARYLAGEAAAYAHTWSLVADAFAAINRHELPELTPDWVNVDHRRGAAFAAGEMTAYLHDLLDDVPDIHVYAEVVHRLGNLGAVVTQAGHGTSQEGFQAEWREIGIFMFAGDLLSRYELFDEADLDAALARFDELQSQAPRLENAASQVEQRFLTYFAARDWDAYAEILSDDVCIDDRRHVVNAGVRHGRDAEIANVRALADIGVRSATSTVIAVRGGRVFLGRLCVWGGWSDSEASETLCVLEINAENQIVARVLFDADDIDAAFTELDARYLAGEVAPYAHIWTAMAQVQAAYNRHEVPPTTADCVNIDHRSGIAFVPGDVTAYIGATYDVAPNVKGHLEAVHRLGDLGVVVTEVVAGTSQEGFAFEWREVALFAFEGDLVSRFELFDDTDLDAALARFDELQPPTPRLENTASQVEQRFLAYFAARDWDAIAALIGDDICVDDRRRVVNAGVRRGREGEIASLRALADVGVRSATSTVIAVRGGRCFLGRHCVRDGWSESKASETLCVLEINAENQIVARILFDADDLDAAFEELDARYLAGEAAPYAHTWTSVAGAYVAFNRHEIPATPDWVNVDHRRGTTVAPGDIAANIRATWDVAPNIRRSIEAVHRLDNLGAVVTHTAYGTSREGFDAEWRLMALLTFTGDLISRCELFDEEDLDAALARFDQLHLQARRLENAASQAAERFFAYLGAQNWAAMADILADDSFSDDRRRVVNAGLWSGRDVVIAELRETTDFGVSIGISELIATRGQRLVLGRVRWSASDQGAEAFQSEALCITEVGGDGQIVAIVMFDPDDLDAAFEELDARYLSGEAAAHPDSWSAITQACAALSRHEMPRTASNFVDIDRRQFAAIAPGDLLTYIRAGLEDMVDNVLHVEAVHRLTALGAVVTHTAKGTSREGFDAEWRMIDVFTVERDLLSRFELFDEADLDAALARFDELQLPTRRLENAATRADDRFFAYFAAGNWAALAEILTDESFIEDRRPVVNAGSWEGRDAVIANLQAVAEAAANITTSVIATRGERLALTLVRSSNRDPGQGDFGVEMLSIVEIDTNELTAAHVDYDPDDIDAAFAELEARYLAGEGAAHGRTWSVIAGAYASFNKRELPATAPNSVAVEHRPLLTTEVADLAESIRSVWDSTPNARMCVEAVHRLCELGAVVTYVLKGTTPEGFDAEWRMINILTVESDLLSRSEVFDEADLDAALARFDELQPQAPRLENAASLVGERFWKHFAAREWAAMAELVADDIFSDDRRRVVNGGIRRGRGDHMADMRGIAEVLPDEVITPTVIATRGARLALTRICGLNRGLVPGEVTAELLSIVELDADNRILSHIGFDVDDIDAAVAELDGRYLAGEGAVHAHTWSVIMQTCVAIDRNEMFATTKDFVDIDHRSLAAIGSGDLTPYIRAALNDGAYRMYIEAVHRLSDLGAVVTLVARGTSQGGFEAEWRMTDILTVEGDSISRCEIFDDADLDAALAGFDELERAACP